MEAAMQRYGTMALGLAGLYLLGSGGAAASDCEYPQVATPINMAAARKAVDPNNKLSESQRNLAALGAVYQYKLNKDDIAGAQRAAFSMIQHYRVASQQHATIVAAAVEKGDLGAAKAALKAYANAPDGKDFKVEKLADGKFKYSFTDEKTGKRLEAGIEPPDKIAAAAIGFAQKGFDETLLAAAGNQTTRGPIEPCDELRGKPKRALRMPADPLLDIPTMGSRGPLSCITIDMGGGDSATNCH
jgi:hypothetical protein